MIWRPYTPVIDVFERRRQEIINRWKIWWIGSCRILAEPN